MSQRSRRLDYVVTSTTNKSTGNQNGSEAHLPKRFKRGLTQLAIQQMSYKLLAREALPQIFVLGLGILQRVMPLLHVPTTVTTHTVNNLWKDEHQYPPQTAHFPRMNVTLVWDTHIANQALSSLLVGTTFPPHDATKPALHDIVHFVASNFRGVVADHHPLFLEVLVRCDNLVVMLHFGVRMRQGLHAG